MKNYVNSALDWKQLTDPTNLLHLHGFIWLNVAGYHALSSTPLPNLGLLFAAAFGSFATGGTIDLVQLFLSRGRNDDGTVRG
jgi:hypothetical protein